MEERGDRPRALIVYDGLPISSGGAHRLRSKDRAAIWQKVSTFLDRFTTYHEPDEVDLVLYEQRVEPNFFAKAYELARSAFGWSQRSVAVSGETDEYQHIWTIRPTQVSKAIDLMERLDPFPEHWLGGPLVLVMRARFLLRDPDTGDVFPIQGAEFYGGQEAAWDMPLGVSVIRLRLANPSTCVLFLSLPFPEVTQSVKTYVRNLEGSLPSRPSKKHWSR